MRPFHKFFFGTLGLQSTFTEIGIDDSNYDIMANKAITGGTMYGFRPLAAKDIINIFKMCQ